MVTLTFNIPDDKADWVLNGLGMRYGYEDMIDNPDYDPETPVDPITNPMQIDNTETKAQFAKRMIKNIILTEASIGYQNIDNQVRADEANQIDIT